jgi:enoyl-CoA hydratase/carnithine racemase
VARYVSVEQRGDVALVRVDRPPANALDLELLGEVTAAAVELQAAAPGAVVLTGREGFFSAGLDLKLVPTLDGAGQRAMVEGVNRVAGAWYAFPRPVVCAVNGHAIAGGLVIALCGDYRVGCTSGKLGLTELRAGVPYPAVPMAVVRAELSAAAARVLALRSHLVDPEEALALGMLDELTAPEDVLERALVVAAEMAELPREAYAATKRELRGETIARIERVLEEGDPLVGSWLAPGSAEAAADVLRDGGPS